MIIRFSRWLVRKRLVILALSLMLAGAASMGLRYLRFKNDYRMFFGKENPQLVAFEALQRTYTKSDNILFVLAPDQGDVFTRPVLSMVEELTRRAWTLPYARRVDSLTNFQNSEAQGDTLAVDDLVRNAERVNDSQLARIRSIALGEPLLVHRLVSPSGHVTGVNVTLQLPEDEKGTEV